MDEGALLVGRAGPVRVAVEEQAQVVAAARDQAKVLTLSKAVTDLANAQR